MTTIWKFELAPDTVEISMPQGAKILSAGVQPQSATYVYEQTVCVWAMVESDAPKVTRRFCTIGTGHPATLADTGVFVGTVMLVNGALVFHVFDLGEVSGD